MIARIRWIRVGESDERPMMPSGKSRGDGSAGPADSSGVWQICRQVQSGTKVTKMEMSIQLEEWQ
jgi:hypothetical protein